jgi:ABC-2 type transport system ATP-binding protein
MTKHAYAIEATGLTKSYGKTSVLKGIDLRVERGTMLRSARPQRRRQNHHRPHPQHSAAVRRWDRHRRRPRRRPRSPDAVRRVIGLTGQSAAVDELLTGRENLVMMGRLYRLTTASPRPARQELLADFDLTEAADRPAKTYSGGMRRRLDLAVSLIATPPIIFLDEPTTGLDPRSRIAMWDIIKKLMAQGTTILLTTQYLEEADQLADRIVVIDGGKVIAEGTASRAQIQGRQATASSSPSPTPRPSLLPPRPSTAASPTRTASDFTVTLVIDDVNTDVTSCPRRTRASQNSAHLHGRPQAHPRRRLPIRHRQARRVA